MTLGQGIGQNTGVLRVLSAFWGVLLGVSREIAVSVFSWEKPLLPAVAAWLVSRGIPGESGQVVDLRDHLIVVPVAAARRRLSQLLVQHARGRLLSPEIMTPAELPEHLYPVKRPFVSSYTQQMAWRWALMAVGDELLHRVVPRPPAVTAFREWLALADLLARQHRELAADGLDFQQVAGLAPKIPGFPEQSRWEALGRIEKLYLDKLDSLGLWDRQEARLYAIAKKECRSERPIVLIGTSDLNQIVRKMLDEVLANSDCPGVTAVVHGPKDGSDYGDGAQSLFDSHGCLNVPTWEARRVPILPEMVRVAEKPEDQAVAVGLCLAELSNEYSTGDVAIACPDERIVPPMRRRLSEAGIATSWAVGRSLDKSRPGRLLAAIAEHVDRPTAESSLRLLRQPDVLRLVEEPFRDKALSQLDAFRAARYPRRLQADQIESIDPEKLASAAAGVRVVDDLAEPFSGSSKRTVSGWADALLELCGNVFGGCTYDVDDLSDSETLATIDRLTELAQQFDRCPSELDLRVSASDAIRVVISRLAEQAASCPDNPEAVSLTGWLEMALDDRPVAIVTAFNEGVIPTSVTSDLFLPGSLRHFLGLNDNSRRFARDAYAASVLIRSSRVCRFVVGKSDAEGTPLAPSRLLFTGAPDETLAMFQRLYSGAQHENAGEGCVGFELPTTWFPRRRAWACPVPPIDRLDPDVVKRTRVPVTLSVTAFKSFIACPYRFYLSHLVGLRPADQAEEELSASAFGGLLHSVLSAFGRDAVRHSVSDVAIREFVLDTLASHAKAVYGSQPLPAIQVQLQKARKRLERFSVVQAEHRAAGWNVSYSEDEEADHRGAWTTAFPDAEGKKAFLKGRIDRVDRHDDGRWLILDYKTGDTAKSPLAAHINGKSKEWIDLQLPLYRHLASQLEIDGPVATGYFNLPQAEKDCVVEVADFTDAQLDEADDLARLILAKVRRLEVHGPPEKVSFDDFAAICQADVLQVVYDAAKADDFVNAMATEGQQ